MTPIDKIMAAIKANATVAGLVGTKIFLDAADETVSAPFVVIGREPSEDDTMQTLCDLIENPSVTFDVRCWAVNRSSAEALADACVSACFSAGHYIKARDAGYSDVVDLSCAIIKVVLD